MNNVLYDTKTNEIVLLTGFTKELRLFKSEITIHVKYLNWLESFMRSSIDQNGRFNNASEYKRDL